MSTTIQKTVVITGSTRGIGMGMAREFLLRGHQVVVCGRSTGSTQNAVDQLRAEFGEARVLGQACDVGQFDQVRALWDAAVARFGRVDIWINNAGLSHPMHMLWELDADRYQALVDTNVHGVLNGAKVAIRGMLQQGGGQVYNMEGFGSDGGVRAGLSLYGATKYAVAYINKALKKETADTQVQVCALSPGIVITDLLYEGYVGGEENLERAKRVFNILGDKVETVTPYLVENILDNEKGGDVRWLTTPKIIWRFVTAPFNKREVFDTEPDKTPETPYN